MERETFFFGSLALNALLAVGLVYFYYAAQRASHRAGMASEQAAARGEKRSVAILVSIEDPLALDLARGVRETLERDAEFDPQIREFHANGSRTLMRSSIEEAVAQDYDVIVALGSQPAQMAKEVTEKREKNIPVVFAATGDPVRLELVDTPERSGNHLTGVCGLGNAWIAKMIDCFPTLMPGVKRVLIPYDPTGLGGLLESYRNDFERELKSHGMTATCVKVYESNEAVQKVAPYIDDCDVVLTLPDATMTNALAGLAKLCEQRQKGLVAQSMGALDKGASMVYGYHTYDVGVLAAAQVRMILEKGIAPTDIPVNPMNDAYRVGIDLSNIDKQGMDKKFDTTVLYVMENAEVR